LAYRSCLAHERPAKISQTTSLIDAAYRRLTEWNDFQWQDRARLLSVAARRSVENFPHGVDRMALVDVLDMRPLP
jgi:hypothetical protein